MKYLFRKDKRMKYYLITGRIPETETESAHDAKIEIGESNPFDTSGKPFKVMFHESLGIPNVDTWKRLIKLYATRISHEFFITPEGLKKSPLDVDIVPAFHLISLLHDGFAKSVSDDAKKIIYSKQKGRIEDDHGKTYTPEEMIAILEGK